MEIEGCQEFDLEFEDHDLIDSDQFPETVDAKKVVNSLDNDVDGHLPELCESIEPEKNQRNGKYNLRKSLAWDSAFFTSAGVLDAEELSSIITGPDKNKKHVLPGIQEEISGSTESISTLQTDSLTLETLDDDLFLDIRASIQRSSKKASNSTYLSNKITAMELVGGSPISSPKKEEFVSQNKNSKPGVNKTSGLRTVRMSKSQLKPTEKPSGKPIKQGSVQSQTGSIHKTGETSSVLPRPLKNISSSLPATAVKRDSVGTGRIKPERGSTKQGPISCKESQFPKVFALGDSRKVLPKPAVSLQSSLGSSTTSNVHSTRSSTSSDSSVNTSSGNATKPTVMTARRNVVKKSNISIGSSGSLPKAPSRAVPKNKLPAPSLSSYLKSTKISASISPASSISEWSSASSTSSVVNQISNYSRTSVDTNLCRSVDGDKIHLDPRHNLAGQKAERLGNQGVMLTSRTSKKSSTESGTLQAPAKPSGLRLPSPKIGFFDGSSSRTPNGHQRSHSSLHPGLPKNGTATSTPTRSSNGKLKSAKVPTGRMSSSLANVKCSSPKAASSLANIKCCSPKAASPAYSQEKLHALVNTPILSMDVTLGVKCTGTGETCQKVLEFETENGEKQVVLEGTGAVGKDNSDDLCLNKNVSCGDGETTAGEDNYTSGSGSINQASTSTQSPKGRLKSAEIQTAKMANIKSGSPKDASSASPQEKSHTLVKVSTVSMDVNDLSILSLGVKGNETGETSHNAMEDLTGNCDEQVVDAGTNPHDKTNFGDLCLNKSINTGHIETPGEGSNIPGLEYISPIEDGMLINKNSVPTSEATKKENDSENYLGGGLTEDKSGTYKQNHETNCQLSDKSECTFSSTAATCMPTFALKNFSCSSECSDNPTELVIQFAGAGGVGKDNSCELSSNKINKSDDIETAGGDGIEYISQTGDSIVPTFEATEKENDPGNCQGQGLTTEKSGIYQKKREPNCQLLNDKFEPNAAVCRPPFALKNSCSNEFCDSASKLAVRVAVAENTITSWEEKENS